MLRRRSMWRSVVVLLGCCAAVAAGDDGEEEGGKAADILEVMAWCKDVNDGLDWGQVLRIAKTECNFDAPDDEALRIRCSAPGLAAVVDGTRLVVEVSAQRQFACANGLIFLLSVALCYGREGLSEHEALRAKVLLWQALQENFMLDASIWPVKTFDVLRLFDMRPAAFDLSPLPAASLASVTVVAPRCPPELGAALARRLPGVRVIAGAREEVEGVSGEWTYVDDVGDQPVGMVLNRMLAEVETPLVLVVLGAALPRSTEDVERLVAVLQQRHILAVGGPVLSEDRVYSDFCYRLRPRHYHLRFNSVYEHSIIFDESSAASVRGSWFKEEDAGGKDGPCKLCETLPPTFLARTAPLRALGFSPALDAEWALLDLAMRARSAPLVRVVGRGADGEEFLQAPGRRHGPPAFALCPFAVAEELLGLGGPHLYGRSDLPESGVAPAAPWFEREVAALGRVVSGSEEVMQASHLRPDRQAKTFMELNNLRDFTGPDGITRHFGCNLAVTNCPVPNWVYRGWAVPPCCKETMRHLLFYIDEVFREMGIRYIITDGVLLGSYKYGSMLDWDADVDLHIHNDDFHRLETEVQHRVKADGHYLRKHVNNVSWLLQANDHNYLLIELNLRREFWDPDRIWRLPVEGRLFPAMEDAHLNISTWYGMSFFRHRLRHVPEWEEEHRPMFCSTPYHYNCVDEGQVPSGKDCRHAGVC